MKTKSLLTTKTILTVVAIVSVATIAHLTLSPNTDAASLDFAPRYSMAEGIFAVTTFTFKEGVETVDFPVFKQANDLLDKNDPRPTFVLEGIVGNYPYLHKAADQARHFGAASDFGQNFNYKFFDVGVDVVQAGQIMRSYSYGDCRILDYKINTQLDKEEGYFSGKKTGFALVESYTVECEGYKPQNIALAEMNQVKYDPTTVSTMAYELKQSELQARLNGQNNGK